MTTVSRFFAATLLALVAAAWGSSTASAGMFVLSIGIEPDETASGKRDWYAKDAEYVRDAFKAAEPIHGVVETRVVNGAGATRAAVTAGLQWLTEKTGPDDVAVVFFSSHGDLDENGGYYVPLAKTPDPADLERVRGAELMKAFAAVRGKLFVFLDTCSAAACLNVDAPADLRAGFLLACETDEGSSGQYKRQDRPHGFFVIALCEGLAGRSDVNADGVVTFGELCGYVPDRAGEFYLDQNAVSRKHPAVDDVALTQVDPARKDESLLDPVDYS
ncbi:MAG: caspase family protein, partial [Planctomycetia bacterium]